MIKIICDRCSKEISDGNVGYLATNWRSMEDGSLLGDNPHEEKHFCSSCMKEIEEFVIKTPENVIKTSESVSETPESVSKGDESVSVCEEPPAEQEDSKGKRRQIGLSIKTDCFKYDPDKKDCTIMTDLICMKRKCSFYKPEGCDKNG